MEKKGTPTQSKKHSWATKCMFHYSRQVSFQCTQRTLKRTPSLQGWLMGGFSVLLGITADHSVVPSMEPQAGRVSSKDKDYPVLCHVNMLPEKQSKVLPCPNHLL